MKAIKERQSTEMPIIFVRNAESQELTDIKCVRVAGQKTQIITERKEIQKRTKPNIG